MLRRGYAVIVGAACAVLVAGALAGCTPPPPRVAGPSQDQVDQYTEQQLASVWGSITVPHDLDRPTVAPVRTISNDEYDEVVDECLRSFSDRGYRNLPGYRRISQEPQSERVAMLEGVSWYVCMAMYPFDAASSGLLSRAQLDYLYDYYRRWVVPCLVLSGHDPGSIPVRETFVANGMAGNFWSPLDTLWSDAGFNEDEYESLNARCDTYPDYLYPDS